MNTMTVGEALVDLLSNYGVEVVFGIPGTHSIELYRGLESRKICHILPRHEQGAGFMADGYARSTGKPGVCFVITGPGVTNITTPLGEAYMDSVPMLVISPVNDPDPNEINRGRLHEITSQTKVTQPITALSTTITALSEIPQAIEQAFRIFQSKRPQPVHISIPLSVFPQIVETPWKSVPPTFPNKASSDEVNQCVEWLSQSTSPVLVVGGGATSEHTEVIQLAERIGCPVISTVAGRGILPRSHPLNPGAQLRAPYIQDILGKADLGIFLGTELAQTDHWNEKLVLPTQQVWVNLDPEIIKFRTGTNKKKTLGIEADCIDFSHRVAESFHVTDASTESLMHDLCAAYRNINTRNFTSKETKHWRVLEVISETVPDDVTIVSDMTQLAYTAVGYLPMNRPKQWLHPTGYGTLGYALPAAIGVLVANPSKAALVIVGDAGFQYTFQEMTLASELELNIVVLLWNNNALMQIQDDMDNANIQRIAVKQSNPDFLMLAKACHWEGCEVKGLDTLAQDIEKGFSKKSPVLLTLDEQVF